MLRITLHSLAASSAVGGFSSASFTSDDGGASGAAEQLRRSHNAASAEDVRRGDRPGSGFHTSASASGTDEAVGERPTIDTYRQLTDGELVALLSTRESQVRQLRQIYENFHYEADKHFRKMVFDYHDKTLQLSQVHGRMQQASVQVNREALVRMREEQEMLTRDKRLMLLICTVVTLVFWVWVRRHYVARQSLEGDPSSAPDRAALSRTVTGAGSYNDNFFGSANRNARFKDTAWEKEVRHRREVGDREAVLQQHQQELQRLQQAHMNDGPSSR